MTRKKLRLILRVMITILGHVYLNWDERVGTRS